MKRTIEGDYHLKKTSGDNKKKKIFIPAIAIIIVLFTVFLAFCIPKAVKVIPDLTKLKEEEYDTVFMSMYPIDYYEEEDYATLRGMNIIKCSNEISCSIMFRVYMKWIAMAGKPVTTVYLGVDPEKTDSEDLIELAQSYPGISFEMIYFHPQISYWMKMEDSKYEKTFSEYQELARNVIALPNVRMYLFSGQEWLICNPLNYEKNNATNPEVSYLLMGLSDYLHPYLLTTENMESMFAHAGEVIHKYREQTIIYPDAGNTDIVFIGDSIIGNYTDSTSIPQVVSALCKGRVYNLGVGGMTAATKEGDALTANMVVDALLNEQTDAISGNVYLCSQLRAFIDREKKENLMFVFNYGLNDYFNSVAIEGNEPLDESTFMGAYRAMLSKIQMKFPDAVIVLCTPNYTITIQEDQQQIKYKEQESYANAVKALAGEFHTEVLDNFKELPIDNENWSLYLADGVHLNEQGRFMFGERLTGCIP